MASKATRAFAVGDRVRVTGHTGGTPYSHTHMKVGGIATVVTPIHARDSKGGQWLLEGGFHTFELVDAEKHTFKVGDRVRVTGHTGDTPLTRTRMKVGDIATVVTPIYARDSKGSEWALVGGYHTFKLVEDEKHTFKVGDKVRVVSEVPKYDASFLKGDILEVVEVLDGHNRNDLIIRGSNRVFGSPKNGFTQVMHQSDLELAEPTSGFLHIPPSSNSSIPSTANPKASFGAAKPATFAIPPVAILGLGRVMANGADKYGLMNFRDTKVSYSTYFDAALRHFLQSRDGQDIDTDSGADQLEHVMACCAIILDAKAHGMLIDDRGPVQMAASHYITTHTKRI